MALAKRPSRGLRGPSLAFGAKSFFIRFSIFNFGIPMPLRPPRSKNAFERLVKIMANHRSKQGCPWERKQTHKSLKPYLIEEAYEVLEAIDSGDPEKLKNELGDLLLQAVFHAEVATRFDIGDVAKAI